MPPRKKAKASAASTPLAETQPKTPQDTTAAAQEQELLNNPWTDDQETQLFKSIMYCKPTGIHKHFRMIAIHNDMRSHGFATDSAPHTRIQGIWRRLGQLFDLRALDERENAHAFGDDPDPTDPADAAKMPEFELPEDEFGQLMWEKRFHSPESAAGSSPPAMSTEDDKALYTPGAGLLKDLPGVRSHKAESTAETTPTPKNTKNTRASKASAKAEKGKGRDTRANGQATKNSSKAQSAVSSSVEDDDDDEDENGQSSETSDRDTAPTTRRTNRSTGTRARPAPKRRKR